MNYSNHNLRTDLQEWKNRLYRVTLEQFGHQIQYFLNNLVSKKQLYGILSEVSAKYKYDSDQLNSIIQSVTDVNQMNFENEAHQAAFCFQLFNHYLDNNQANDIMYSYLFDRGGMEDTRQNMIKNYFEPIIYFLHDKLNKSNSTIFLLEKYKKRTEWFTHKSLLTQYQNAHKNYEQIFEDDLRLFLFDQGIDYPFSTPSSPSGRTDVIGNLDTDDPLVVEIKIFDQRKGYGKNRISNGFHQVVKYTNDFNKDMGYLVVYNMDTVEIHLQISEKSNTFPPSIHFNNKVYYIVIVNLNQGVSASKAGKLKEIEVTELDLISSIES